METASDSAMIAKRLKRSRVETNEPEIPGFQANRGGAEIWLEPFLS